MTNPYRILVVCTGNICRSIMAEIIVREHAEQRGLNLELASAGVSPEETGNYIDPRAQKELTDAGYSLPEHSAHQATREELESADLILAMTAYHKRALQQLCMRYAISDADIRLFRTFDPECAGSSTIPDVEDPWYGGPEDFVITRETIERCTPPILDYVEEQLATR
ncbi:MAG TPA: low molecular weight phosphotyrosine protein phosphatase [Corynebacteriales bacterium]|nr:low molecular weight phosphotyrosine protein phosphatase [Mycobacteriales bacterium]